MNEMIERVATALCLADPDSAEKHKLDSASSAQVSVCMTRDYYTRSRKYIDMARAAIAAMRNPTEQMHAEVERSAYSLWQSSIDEALR